jgi:hypothetical protein
VTWLSGLGVPSGQLAPLDKLAARLRASETATPDLAGLLDEALATLAVFAGEDPADTFWKRHV